MRIETDTERLRIQEAEVASRKRLADLRANALGLALRFARDGSGDVGAELASALKECLQACEAVVRDVTAARQRLGVGEVQVAQPREEHVSWLASLRTNLLQGAADVHREAEFARSSNNTRAAGRLFAMKNRFESLAAALGDLAAHSDGSKE